MDDWYNNSLARYPKVLLQRERAPLRHPLTRTNSGDVVSIRIHSRGSGGEEGDHPSVTVHRHSNKGDGSQPQVTVGAMRSGIAIPIQIRHLTSGPVTNIACAQPHKNYPPRPEPMRAVPLSSVNYGRSSSPVKVRRQRSADDSNNSHLFSEQFHPPLPEDVFDSFQRQFDQFTSEYTSPFSANKSYARSHSQNVEASTHRSYVSRRHCSENLPSTRLRHCSGNLERSAVMGERAPSPTTYVSSYTRTIVHTPRQSPARSTPTSPEVKLPTSPPIRMHISQHETTKIPPAAENGRQEPTSSVARAKWVLDKVLKTLVTEDGRKGQRRNSVVSEAKDTIQKLSDELASGKTCQIDDTDSGYSGSGDTTRAGFTWTTLDIKEQIRKYNDKHTDSKLTKVGGEGRETFQGHIQICMCLEQPVNMLLSTRPKSIFESFESSKEDERITASATIPRNTITRLHITSDDTTDTVIQQLLNKFNIIDSPKSYGLYEETLDKENNKGAKLRKLAYSERPLINFLRWSTENGEKKRFLLKESYSAEILWESFSIPELSNFILMLEMEYQQERERISSKYSTYRHNIQSKMKELRPGLASF